MDGSKIDQLARVLSRQIDKELFAKKYAPTKEILVLVGAGAFLTASIFIPGLPKALKPFLDQKRKEEKEIWKRFNIPYLKRTLSRLERQKSIEISEENGRQIVKITNHGRQKILKFSLDNLEIKKPKIWDRKWRLVSFDLPETLSRTRKILVEYFSNWEFYPLHKSVYLHMYPVFKEVDFLREYLGVSKYVRVFTVSEIENDKEFKEFFGV